MLGTQMELWTFLASMFGVLAFVQNLLPKEFRQSFDAYFSRAIHYFNPYVFFDVPEFYGAGGNEIYDHVQTYLSSTTAIAAHHVNICRPKNATQNTFSLANNELIEVSVSVLFSALFNSVALNMRLLSLS